jgi:hypothetical protein
MSQNDFVIANDTAANVRADLNLALQALASQSSGATAPATTYANMQYYDTATNFLEMRSEADDAWIKLGTLDQSTNTFSAEVDALGTSDWEAGTGTTEAVISPAKLAAGIAALAGGSAAPFAVQVFTASGTYTPTSGAVSAWVIVTGGGAGGGDSTSETGGAGSTAIKLITGAAFSAITTSTITVGSGGAGDSFSGNDGGTSSWSDGTTTLTALGGDVGSAANRAATGGDINISGSSGGGSFWGGGGVVGISADDSGGSSFTYGAGGGLGNGGNTNGGNGMSGVVYVLEFGS